MDVPTMLDRSPEKEFSESFRSYHIPTGVVELKPDEFRALKQGSMAVCEYHNS